MVPKRRRPPRLSGGGLGGPKAAEAPSPQRRGPRWSQCEGGPLASAEGASVVPKRRRPPRLSGGGLGSPKAMEAPSPQRRGPRCVPKPPRGVPIPPRPRQDRRDSGVTAAVWGRDLSVRPQTPTGRPYPSAAQAGPEGLGCNRRCVGEGPLRAPPNPHGASLSLRGPGRTGETRV